MAQYAKSHYTTRKEFGADKVQLIRNEDLIQVVCDDWNSLESLKNNTDSKGVRRVPVYLINKRTMQFEMDEPWQEINKETGEVITHERRVIFHEEYDAFSTEHWNILAVFTDNLDHIARENTYLVVHSVKTLDANGKVTRVNTFTGKEVYVLEKSVKRACVGIRIEAGEPVYLKRTGNETVKFDFDAFMETALPEA